MSKRAETKATILLALGMTLLGGGLVDAQEQQAASEESTPQTMEQQLGTAQAVVTRGERLSQQISNLMAQATREKDIIRVNCLDDKLGQTNAHLRTARDRLDKLRGQNEQQRQQTITVVLVLKQNFDVLEAEAGECTGQKLFEAGVTKLETETDKSIVPTNSEVNAATVPGVITINSIDSVQTQSAPPPEEASGKS